MGQNLKHYKKSRPTRARGLKLFNRDGGIFAAAVAPHAGAWIETHL